MKSTFIFKEIVKELRSISSETAGKTDIWICDQLVNYIIEINNKLEVKDGTMIIYVADYVFNFKFGHMLRDNNNYYNHLISFKDSEEEVYKYEVNISDNEKEVKVL